MGTGAALAVLSSALRLGRVRQPWGHAVPLPLRFRSARRGNAAGLRAVMIIGGVLLVVNVAEAAVRGVVPTWMRIETVVIAVLMGVLLARAAAGRRNP